MTRERAKDATVVIDEFCADDAAALAVMWNESNDSWPGGFNAGPLYDAARIGEWVEAHDALSRMVARDGATIVGYCDLVADCENALSIPLLNVHPKHQGRGIGRDLLLRAIATAAATPGVRRLVLRTWPANVGAVPLYKKTGFFWEPGTAVSMVNYLPEVVRHPLVAGFFRSHDWYHALKRDLALTEDKEMWRNCQVFSYRFAEGGDRLTVVIDRASHAVTAVETGRLSVRGWRGCAKGAVGAVVPIGLEVEGTLPSPTTIEAVAYGGATLAASLPDAVAVDALPARLTTEIRLPGESALKDGESHLAGLRVTVSSGDLIAPVDIALPTVHPVRLEYTGGRVIRVGAVERMNFRVTNRLAEPVTLCIEAKPEGVLTLPGGPGATAQPVTVTLAAESTGGFDVTAIAAGPGVGVLRLSGPIKWASGTCAADNSFQVIACGTGAAIGAVSGDAALLVNDFIAVEVSDGAIAVTDRLAARASAHVSSISFGPPFQDRTPVSWAARQVAVCGSESLELTGRFPDGATVTRQIALAGSVVMIHDRLCYGRGLRGSPRSARLTVRSSLRSGRIAAPLASGLTASEIVEGEYPLGQDYRDSPGLVSEGWMAAWDGAGAVGLISAGQPSLVFWSRILGQLTHRLPDADDQSAVDLPELRIYAGPGDWRTVRALWLATGVGEPAPPAIPSPVTGASLAPRPALAGDDSLRLEAENRRDTPRGGIVGVSLPCGWRAGPATIPVGSVSMASPARATVELSRDCRDPGLAAGAAEARIAWQAGDRGIASVQSVFCLKADGDVTVSAGSGGEWSVANGRLTLGIGTAPAAGLFSLREGARDYLASSFPDAGSFVDIAPWYGGLHPQVSFSRDDWPGRGYSERYGAEPVSIHGARGFGWRGVRLTTTDARTGITRSVDLLTLPWSNVVAVLTRIVNGSEADQTLSFGIDAYPARGAGVPVRYVADAGTPAELTSTRCAADVRATLRDIAWLAVGDAPSFVMVAPGARMRLDDYGRRGVLVSTVVPWNVAAHRTSERLTFLVAAGGGDAGLYRDFIDLTALP